MLEVIRRNYLNLSLAALALAAGLPASAATVDYTTTGMFTCSGCTILNNGTGDVTVTYGTGANTATLLFTGSPTGTEVNSDAEFSTASYGTKHYRHRVLGDLTLDCDVWDSPDGSDQRLMVLTAEPGTPSAKALAQATTSDGTSQVSTSAGQTGLENR